MIEHEDDAIRALVTRLSRPHPTGGRVIERAAILAEGANSAAILVWISDHAGEPEAIAAQRPGRGLHSSRHTNSGSVGRKTPLRYVFPPGTLS